MRGVAVERSRAVPVSLDLGALGARVRWTRAAWPARRERSGTEVEVGVHGVGWGAGGLGLHGVGAKAEVVEDAAGDAGVEDGGDEAEAAAAAGAREDVEAEGAAHEVGPGAVARGAGGVVGRTVGDDALTPLGAGGKDAVVEEEVDVGAGDEGRELYEQLDGVEEQVGGAVVPRGLEAQAHPALVVALEALGRQRGSKEVAAEALEAPSAAGTHGHGGMEVEAVGGAPCALPCSAMPSRGRRAGGRGGPRGGR